MDERKRRLIGVGGLVAGTAILSLGIVIVHFTGLPVEDSLGQEIYPDIPRDWYYNIGGKLIAFGGSQVMLGAIVVGWLWGRPMTWAGATIGAFLFTIEMILLFGVVPNEWLGLTQGEFEWTSQKIALTIPKWAVLNNEVEVSYGAIKDAVSGGYAAGVLGAVLVGIYQIQERAKRPASAKPETFSTYGRPVVKGER